MNKHFNRRINVEAITILVALSLMCLLSIYHASNFSIDATADSLLDRNDPGLKFFRATRDRFSGDEQFLFLTFSPKSGSIFENSNLLILDELQGNIAGLEGVESVYSLLDAPLLNSPRVTLAEMQKSLRTLRSGDVDLALARQELTTSPIFSDLLVSQDSSTTALRITLDEDVELRRAWKDLTQLENNPASSASDLSGAETNYLETQKASLFQRDKTLESINDVMIRYEALAVLHLGGVPSIARDVVAYAEADLLIFSGLLFVVIMVMLFLFFRKVRFVFIPVVASVMAILFTIGLLGYLGQNATIVSSNFVSIVVITSISFSIHLIVRYRELRVENSELSHRDLLLATLRGKFAPCSYTALSTIAAFASLLTSGILPVRDFGLIICIGVVVSFVSAYGTFAGFMLLLGKGDVSATLHNRPVLTVALCKVSTGYAKVTLLLALSCVFPVAYGISQLSLDNSFINYFKSSTSIHQGLSYIDKHLGGTTPFDVIIKFPVYETDEGLDDDFFLNDAEPEPYPERYWFTSDKIRLIEQLHTYIESLEPAGKVLSLSSLERVARTFNDDKPLDGIHIVAALGVMPEEIRKELVRPYASPLSGEARISVRVQESNGPFSREKFLAEVRDYGINELGIAPENIHVTGMMVMFNNMLTGLFDSQRASIGFVIAFTFVMFLILLRSPLLAIFGLLPNILAAGLILGVMGVSGIPLDLLTITVAALVIGIGVDDAIHYLHRFRKEFLTSGSVVESIQRCHSSTGHALYFTSVTVIAGFSVLAFSSFVPTIYFGLLASLAMVVALVANLALLPGLLVTFYPDRKTAI